jgi:cell division protein FtsI/penicillin-binding protein 2
MKFTFRNPFTPRAISPPQREGGRLTTDQDRNPASDGDASEKEASAPQSQVRETWRFVIIALIFAAATGLVLLRMLSYQLFPSSGANIAYAAPEKAVERGVIVDRNGDVFAMDRYFYTVSATASHLDEEDRQEVAAILEQLLGLDATQTKITLTEYAEREYALLAKGLTLAEIQPLLQYKTKLEDRGELTVLDSVNIEASPKRFYPEGGLAAHVIGFVGVDPQDETDWTGLYGVERYYAPFLSSDGVGLPEAPNASLDDLDRDISRFLPSPVHKDVVLTLDRNMQWIVEEELERALAYYEAESGSIIVMEPQTGAILAMASRPTYDPNRYASSSLDTFNNQAITAQYEPGSIYKVITMAAAIDTGVITPTTVFTDTGSISMGGRVFFNSNRRAYGRITLKDAFARSLNVVTVQVAQRLGAEDFYRYVRRFGFGQSTEIDLANEGRGLVKSPGDPTWSVSDLGANAFGQGLAVTPIQMLNAVAAIANHGTLMRPYIVQDRIENDEVLHTEPTVVRQVISPESAATMTDLMIYVVDVGVKAAIIPGYTVAGKTGTAQIPTEEGYTEDETIVSFVGFAPADDPKVVVLVKMDRPNPNISPWAAYTAAPVFAKVTRRLLEYLNVPPDDVRGKN